MTNGRGRPMVLAAAAASGLLGGFMGATAMNKSVTMAGIARISPYRHLRPRPAPQMMATATKAQVQQ